MPSAHLLGDSGGHAADRAGPGDEHVLADEVEAQRRVRRVPQRVETAQDIRRDGLVAIPDVGHRHGDVLGKRAVPIDPDPLGGRAKMPPARQAVAATSADHVPFGANEVSDREVVDVAADLNDPPDELVSDGHGHTDGLLCPGVPVVDVHVRAADRGLDHLDQDVVDADPGYGNLFQPQTLFGLALDERFHELLSVRS